MALSSLTQPFKQSRIFLIIVTIVFLSCIFYSININPNGLKHISTIINKENLIKPLKKLLNPNTKEQPLFQHYRGRRACKLSVFDPFQKDAVTAYNRRKDYAKPKCNIIKQSRIEGDGKLIVDNSGGTITSVSVEYIIRGRRRHPDGKLNPPAPRSTGILTDVDYKYGDVLNEDFHVHFSKPVDAKRSADGKQFVLDPLEQDFVRVTVSKGNRRTVEYQSHIGNRTKACRKHGKNIEALAKLKKGMPYNLHMILLDAQSHGNVYRQTKKLVKMLEEDDNAMIFKAHGIHGDGTTCQMMATLAGKSVDL